MTIKNRAVEMANKAQKRAENLSTEFKQSQSLDKAKAAFDETAERVLKVDKSGIKLMNLFAVCSLCSLMFSSLFTFGEYWGYSFSLSESTPAWLYIIAIVTLCSYLLGAKQAVSRSLNFVLLVAIGWRFYEVISESVIHTSSLSRDNYSLPIDDVGFGFYLFMGSLLMVIISMLKPGYQANTQFWGKLIQK
ncbi:hypothetical protein L2737_16225 [Shewanella electrodiphila]|uniref:Uncharacterized protein n=1 Tax=Shewanella electrodiphila TaxID=934143 RepID=A0ABT0KTH3_9GAMM|nr:hypothetical protein [Shewanella electrodiphila]MCL1046856.1 hypothetical protein [Shewanella electrodiphila]